MVGEDFCVRLFLESMEVEVQFQFGDRVSIYLGFGGGWVCSFGAGNVFW